MKSLLRIQMVTLFCLLFALCGHAQTGNQSGVTTAGKSSPVVEARLIEDSSYFQATRATLPPGATFPIEHKGFDSIVVFLGDGLALKEGKESPGRPVRADDVRFLPMGSVAIAANSGADPAEIVIINLKRHWDPEVRNCTEPSKCSRPVRVGEAQIGETVSLFTNGFISAYRHTLERGGTLASSYFSPKGKDHLVLVAATPLIADFEGAEERLKAGQVYFSDATQLEVNAATMAAKWVIIRMHIPKDDPSHAD